MFGLADATQRGDRLLEQTGLAEYSNHLPAQISRGMRQRVALAKALVHDPPILLLDEPFASLDPPGRRWLSNRLAELCSRGCAICLSMHEASEVLPLTDRVYELSAGCATLRRGKRLPPATAGTVVLEPEAA
jgi:ABC-type multidrug transport system ATPase subunit